MSQADKGRVSAKHVAIEAEVSVSAVSRTFTEGASVSERTRTKVLRAAEKLGYRPNILARSLMTQRSELVGLVSTNFRNPAFMEIFDRFTRGLQVRKLRPLIINLTGEMAYEQAIDLLIQYRVDGVIVASSTLPEAFSRACLEARLPAVIAFGRGHAPHALSSVSVDNQDGGRRAARLLLERGYRRIGFLGGPRHATTTVDRLKGFRAGLKTAGLEPQAFFCDHYAHAEGLATAAALFETHPDTEAVFCGDDILAMGAMDWVRSTLGKRVPQEVGLLGFNDISMARWPAYDLTTIRQPVEAIIAAAIDMVGQRIEAPSAPPQARVLPCETVIRSTLREPL